MEKNTEKSLKKYAHIKDSKVINILIWDGVTTLPDQNNLVEIVNNEGIGWDYIEGKFIDNRPPPERLI